MKTIKLVPQTGPAKKKVKLSKTEKIKRLRLIKKNLGVKSDFMCCIYRDLFYPRDTECLDLFIEIPELWKFRPPGTLTKGENWWVKGGGEERGRKMRIEAINKTINYIKTK